MNGFSPAPKLLGPRCCREGNAQPGPGRLLSPEAGIQRVLPKSPFRGHRPEVKTGIFGVQCVCEHPLTQRLAAGTPGARQASPPLPGGLARLKSPLTSHFPPCVHNPAWTIRTRAANPLERPSENTSQAAQPLRMPPRDAKGAELLLPSRSARECSSRKGFFHPARG